jgi:hypothetical protein
MTKKEYKELLERFRNKTAFINKATIDTIIEETPEEQEQRIKMLLEPSNYGLFFNYYFGKDTPVPMADSDCAWYHTAIYKDLYYNAYLTIFNFIFRGGAKSTHANMGYPFALKQAEIAKFFLTVGINEIRAAMLLQDLQVQFEANNRIVKDFGMQKSYGSWADGQFETTDRCTFMALGLNQPFRGLRANGVRVEYASVDDCEDAKTALNKSLILEYAGKVTGDIQGAFSKRSERTIINNNYFAEDGLMTELLRRKGFNPKTLVTKENLVRKEKYAHIYLVNLTTKYYDQVRADNTAEWEPSWSERYTKGDCLRKIEQYKNDQATLSGEFYNTPVKVGKLFKPEWIRWVTPKPLNEYTMLIGHWDFSYTTTGDTKAFALIGCDDDKFTVLDIFCGHYDIADALEYHFRNAKKWFIENGACIFYYDASVSQQAIYEPILVQASIRHKSFMLPLPEHSTTDKYSRISATLTSAFRSGKLQFSEEIQNNPDWVEAELQLLGFEKGSKLHDDFPDTLEAAVRLAQTHYYGESNSEDNKPVIGKRKRGGY